MSRLVAIALLALSLATYRTATDAVLADPSPASASELATQPVAGRLDAPALASLPVAGQAADLDNSAPNAIELALYALTNQDRAQQGLAPLDFDSESLAVARARVSAQFSEPALNHYDSAGHLAFVGVLDNLQIPYTRAGENLARVGAPESSAPDRAESALMASPTHRANILEPSFDHVAIGAALDPSGRVVFAEIFREAP